MTHAANRVPEGAPSVIPRLFCRDPGAEVDFCAKAFGAAELVRRAGPGVALYVYVDDVDAAVERAVAGAAKVLIPATNQFWGDRTAWVLDPEGHVWTVATRIEELTEEDRRHRFQEINARAANPHV
jgi:PhnB protein